MRDIVTAVVCIGPAPSGRYKRDPVNTDQPLDSRNSGSFYAMMGKLSVIAVSFIVDLVLAVQVL